ncbi:MAG: L-threonylcarbamoyladenylate synthase [Candidatus Wenzhouxiangella sp. M2_3B_020]
MIRLGATESDLARAAGMLRAGKLVAFPTETVYGLGADACDVEAVEAIFRVKGRPSEHPVIVHLPDERAMDDWADAVPAAARQLARAFWPGPLTLVLPRAGGVDDVITGGQETVGLRVPGNPVARRLLEIFGGALAAPSANRFGHLSPTTAEHVLAEFGDEVAAVVDGGPCSVGLESTIVAATGDRLRLLRPGMISTERIEAVVGEPVEAADDEAPRTSGRLPSHYSPRTPVVLVTADEMAGELERARKKGMQVVVLSRETGIEADAANWTPMPLRPEDYARALYAELHRADGAGCDRIIVERPPEGREWDAVRDRLSRAAA